MQPRQAVVVRRNTNRILLLVLLVVAGVTVTCNHDVGDSNVSRPVRLVPPAATSALVGFDPGLALTQPAGQLAVAGTSLPRSGASDLTIAFLAFVTAAAADDGDGNGTPLDRSTPAPTDANGADDVFLAAVVNTERTIAGQAVPTAFTQGLAPVFRDQRCVLCHSFHYPGGWRVAGHFGAMPAGSNAGCTDCHKNTDILVQGQAPASVSWLAPDVDQVANPTQDFRGKADSELYDLVMSQPDPRAHLKFDDKILWAIGHGLVPFRGPSVGGRVPMDPQQWQNMVEAWAQAGMQFSTTSAISDVVLASRRSTVDAAGNGASSQPSIAFVPNAGYSPAAPTAEALGTVFVAFTSASTNLTPATATTRNVYRAAVEAWLLPSGAIDLRFLAGETAVVSSSTSGGVDTNGDSDSPAIDASGDRVAFVSAATNLVPGFVASGSPRSNVYLRNMVSGSKALLSHAAAAVTQSGNGDSIAPAISATGGVVAFESDADDLVDGDGNGNRDVFVVRTTIGGAVQRASVRSGGAEATGGDSGHSTVFRDAATDGVFVAFQSSADFGGGGAVPAVFVHDPAANGTQRLGDAAATLREPRFTPDGSRLLFVSAAALDTVRADQNGVDDVISLDFAAFRSAGRQDFERATVAATGNDADAGSAAAAAGGFVRQDGSFNTDELLAFTTAATNIGRSPVSDVIVDFVIDRTIPRVVAEFTSEVQRGVIPFSMSFQDLSNNATAWSWDFGDGGSSTEQHPTHVYTVPGDYTVALTVSGTVGSATATKPAFALATATPRTWSTIYAENNMSTACAGCHVGAQATVTFSMATAATAYTNMVGVNSVLGCMPLKRVLNGNSAQSGLVFAISDPSQCVSFRMGSLSPQAVHDVIDWINNGVPQ